MKKLLFSLITLCMLVGAPNHVAAMKAKTKTKKKKTVTLKAKLLARKKFKELTQYIDIISLGTGLYGLMNEYNIELDSDDSQTDSDEEEQLLEKKERAKKVVDIVIDCIAFKILPISVQKIKDDGRLVARTVELGKICNVKRLKRLLKQMNADFHTVGFSKDKLLGYLDSFIKSLKQDALETYKVLGDRFNEQKLLAKAKAFLEQEEVPLIQEKNIAQFKDTPLFGAALRFIDIKNFNKILNAALRIEEIDKKLVIASINFKPVFPENTFDESDLEKINLGCRKFLWIALGSLDDPFATIKEMLCLFSTYDLDSDRMVADDNNNNNDSEETK